MLILLFAALSTSIAHSSQYFASPLNFYVSDSNFTNIVQHLPFAILFTNQHCQQCQLYDQELYTLISRMTLKVYRCQLSLSPRLQKEFKIKRFPMLHLVIKQPRHNSAINYEIYLNYRPVTIEDALKLEKKLMFRDQEQGILVNLAGLPYLDHLQSKQFDILSYKIEYSHNYIFHSLPSLELFNDPTQYSTSLQKYMPSFQTVHNCPIFLIRTFKCYKPVSKDEQQHIFTTIVFQSVLQFTQEHYNMLMKSQLHRYVFVAVIDSIFAREESIRLLDMLDSIVKNGYFRDKAVIFWMETQINTEKLAQLGFNKNQKAPLFTLFDLRNPKKQLFRPTKSTPFDRKHLANFMRQIISKNQLETRKEQNYALLIETARKVGLEKKFVVLDQKRQIEKEINQLKTGFIFLMIVKPCDEDQDVSNCLEEALLSYHYIIKRTQRFNQEYKVEKIVTFEQISCSGDIIDEGLLFFNKSRCVVLTYEQIIKIQNVPKSKLEMLMNTFNLPNFFWINQDSYEEEIANYELMHMPNWTYVEIDLV